MAIEIISINHNAVEELVAKDELWDQMVTHYYERRYPHHPCGLDSREWPVCRHKKHCACSGACEACKKEVGN